MNLYEVIEKRRDTRHFTNDNVPDEVLQKALMAAHKGPSVGLSQAVRFYLIRKESIRREIYHIFFNANLNVTESLTDKPDKQSSYAKLKLEGILESPIGLIVTTDYSVLKEFTIGVAGTADVLQWSSICSIQNLWLSLTEQGYSMGWVSILEFNKIKNLLQIPSHEMLLGYFCIGKAATDYEGQPMLQLHKWKCKSPMPYVKEINEVYFNEPIKQAVSKLTNTTSIKKSIDLKKALIDIINNKTKPLGALGRLEELALKIGLIQGSLKPSIQNPYIIVFAGDHGISKTGLVNPYPQVVTAQMVKNFLGGGAAINVFCRQHNIELKIVDAGVNYVWQTEQTAYSNFINNKINFGTKNYLEEPAMSTDECLDALQRGKEIVNNIAVNGCNTVGFGEMGIGNTSSASLIMSSITKITIEECVGRGTGVNNQQFVTKKIILKSVMEKYQNTIAFDDPISILTHFGGFEIAMMAGAIIQASEMNMVIIIDGFICTAALLIARLFNNKIIDNCIFAHTSGEQGHQKMLNYLQVSPLLNLGLRLGEGTGAALAIPLLQSAARFLEEMESFNSAQISTGL